MTATARPALGGKEWAREWLEEYDHAGDQPIRNLAGSEPSRDGIQTILAWKLRRVWAPKHVAAFQEADPDWVLDIAKRAVSSEDDLAAALLLTVLPGIKIRTASAVLTAYRPDRFTVMDQRTWKTMGLLDRLTEYAGDSWERYWLPYLAECRNLKHEWNLTLRETDQALFASAGKDIPRTGN